MAGPVDGRFVAGTNYMECIDPCQYRTVDFAGSWTIHTAARILCAVVIVRASHEEAPC